MSWPLALWCATLALVSAGLAVTRPNVVHSLLWLIAALLALAGAFFALGAGFAGAIQILIYAGAITVVFVFVVMTVDPSPEARARERARLAGAWRRPLIVVALLLAPLTLGLGGAPEEDPQAVSAQSLGATLFGDWAAAVELASFLLLAGLLGVRHLARKEMER